MKGHFRPYRSAARPNMMDPTDLIIKTRVMPHVICVVDLSKVSARSATVRLTVKKSNASQDWSQLALRMRDRSPGPRTHAKNPTKKNNHCFVFSIIRSRIGLGALFIGGLRLEKRVATYVPTLILCGASDSGTGSSLLGIFSPCTGLSAMLAGWSAIWGGDVWQ